MYLSPYVEKPLNSKVIKSFVPELRRRKCFSSFGTPMFYVYIRTLCTFHTWPYHEYGTRENFTRSNSVAKVPSKEYTPGLFPL